MKTKAQLNSEKRKNYRSWISKSFLNNSDRHGSATAGFQLLHFISNHTQNPHPYEQTRTCKSLPVEHDITKQAHTPKGFKPTAGTQANFRSFCGKHIFRTSAAVTVIYRRTTPAGALRIDSQTLQSTWRKKRHGQKIRPSQNHQRGALPRSLT